MSSLYLLFEKITFFSKIIVFQSSLYWLLFLCYDKTSPSRQLIKEWIYFSLQSQVRFQHSGGVSMAASIRSGYWSRNLRVHTLNHNSKSKRERKKNTECWWGFLLLKPDSSDVFPLARPYLLNLPTQWQHLGSHVQKPQPMGNNSHSASKFMRVHYYNWRIDRLRDTDVSLEYHHYC